MTRGVGSFSLIFNPLSNGANKGRRNGRTEEADPESSSGITSNQCKHSAIERRRNGPTGAAQTETVVIEDEEEDFNLQRTKRHRSRGKKEVVPDNGNINRNLDQKRNGQATVNSGSRWTPLRRATVPLNSSGAGPSSAAENVLPETSSRLPSGRAVQTVDLTENDYYVYHPQDTKGEVGEVGSNVRSQKQRNTRVDLVEGGHQKQANPLKSADGHTVYTKLRLFGQQIDVANDALAKADVAIADLVPKSVPRDDAAHGDVSSDDSDLDFETAMAILISSFPDLEPDEAGTQLSMNMDGDIPLSVALEFTIQHFGRRGGQGFLLQKQTKLAPRDLPGVVTILSDPDLGQDPVRPGPDYLGDLNQFPSNDRFLLNNQFTLDNQLMINYQFPLINQYNHMDRNKNQDPGEDPILLNGQQFAVRQNEGAAAAVVPQNGGRHFAHVPNFLRLPRPPVGVPLVFNRRAARKAGKGMVAHQADQRELREGRKDENREGFRPEAAHHNNLPGHGIPGQVSAAGSSAALAEIHKNDEHKIDPFECKGNGLTGNEQVAYKDWCIYTLMAEFPLLSLAHIRSALKCHEGRIGATHRGLRVYYGELLKERKAPTKARFGLGLSAKVGSGAVARPVLEGATGGEATGPHDSATKAAVPLSSWAPRGLKLLAKGRPLPRPPLVESPAFDLEWTAVQKAYTKVQEKTDQEVAWKLNEEDYEEEGQQIECGCCYGEYPFERMIQCADGHLFCSACVQRRVEESTFGGIQACGSLPCMDIDGCTEAFPPSEVRRALPAKILERYEQRQADDSVARAKLEGLVFCPFCNCPVEMELEQTILACPNDKCNKASCRQCREPRHDGLRCDQVEKKGETDVRKIVEELMSKALIRNCSKCSTELVKAGGCNKVVCRCGQVMCYVCRKAIAPNYSHFCQHALTPGQPCTKCSSCNLWIQEDEDKVTSKARQEAIDTLTPELREHALGLFNRPIGPSELVPKRPKKLATDLNAEGYWAHPY